MASSSGSAKLAENLAAAKEAYKKAKKFTEKTLTRWKPDWEQASRFYRDAVKSYRLCGENYHTEFIQTCKESAIAHEQINSFHTSATDMEAAANIEANRPIANKEEAKIVAEDYFTASRYYRLNGSPDKGAAMLVKAGELMGKFDADAGLRYMIDACAIFEDENRAMLSDNTFKRAIIYAVQSKKYQDAIDLLIRQNKQYEQNIQTFEKDLFKNNLSIVVLLIHSDQTEKIGDFMSEFDKDPRWSRSDEYEAAFSLSSAIEEGDEEQFESAIKSNHLKYIVNAVAQIARKLVMPKHLIKKKKGKSSSKDTASSSRDRGGKNEKKKKEESEDEEGSEDEGGDDGTALM